MKHGKSGGNTYTVGECMDLRVCGMHLKVGYRRAIEDCEHRVLPMSRLYGFDADTSMMTFSRARAWKFGRKYAYSTSEISMFRQLLNGLSWDQDIAATRRGSAATDHLAVFVPGAYAIFVWTQFLIHLPTLAEFNPVAETEELDRDRMMPQYRSDCSGHVRDTFGESIPVVSTWLHPSVQSDMSQACYGEALRRAHISSMMPLAGRGQGAQYGGHAGQKAGRWPIIVIEIEDSGSEDSEETASDMS
ncbi:hypothetical protein JCGZ_20241 [Jatropha curcas]|uniref:Uncharacterized protein n=1 Tax=Jatropha curcas TaxID=180498 RepID=A0A067JX87_JATCU|nr:hypothetical protein JCGZ_20241 [Jatropha curcas]